MFSKISEQANNNKQYINIASSLEVQMHLSTKQI